MSFKLTHIVVYRSRFGRSLSVSLSPSLCSHLAIDKTRIKARVRVRVRVRVRARVRVRVRVRVWVWVRVRFCLSNLLTIAASLHSKAMSAP